MRLVVVKRGFTCLNFSDLPIRLHTFPSTGVTVLQLSSAQVGSEEVVAKTEQMVEAGLATKAILLFFFFSNNTKNGIFREKRVAPVTKPAMR